MRSRVLALLLAGAALLALLVLLLRPRGGTVAEVRIGGMTVLVLELDAVTGPQEIPVGEHNVLLVEPGRVCMLRADCPDGLCVGMGWTHSPAKPLICLPNGVVVTIRGEGREDAVLG